MKTSLQEALKQVPDPRGRRGRRYPLATLLGLLFLAALAGETSLRGMVQWIHHRIEGWIQRYLEELDLWDIPSYATFYRVVQRMDPGALAKVLQAWLADMGVGDEAEVEVWAVDGKMLRGSRRQGGEAGWKVLHVLEQAAGRLKAVVEVKAGQGEETALVEWLVKQPNLEGKRWTLDAGLMDRTVVQAVVAKKGAMWAGSKPAARGTPTMQ